MAKTILDYDPHTGLTQYHEYDHSTGKTFIETYQDCSDIVKYNQRRRNSHNTSRYVDKGDYYHIGYVPNSILLKWKQELGIDWRRKEDLPKIEKLLSSREWCKLRSVDRI